MTRDELREKANDLPLLPGVYLMMDKTGKVIYVGKAKKLKKNRVSQYFQDTASHNEKTRAMVAQVDRFDTIFVSTEFEALILENSSSSATCRATTSCSRTTRAIPSCGCSRGGLSALFRSWGARRTTGRSTSARSAGGVRRVSPSRPSARR